MALFSNLPDFYQQRQQNPFASGSFGLQQGGLLGGVFAQPAQRLSGKQAEQTYAQMANPYAQWAAQQLQAVSPEPVQQPQQQVSSAQQQALAQMWDEYQRRQLMMMPMGGDN